MAREVAAPRPRRAHLAVATPDEPLERPSHGNVVDLCAWAHDRGYDEVAAEMRENEIAEQIRAGRAELRAVLVALKQREAFN